MSDTMKAVRRIGGTQLILLAMTLATGTALGAESRAPAHGSVEGSASWEERGGPAGSAAKREKKGEALSHLRKAYDLYPSAMDTEIGLSPRGKKVEARPASEQRVKGGQRTLTVRPATRPSSGAHSRSDRPDRNR